MCRATSRADTSGIGRPTSRPSPPTSTRPRACARHQRATYRFVVDGRRREGRTPVPYHLESQPFRARRVGRHHGRGPTSRARRADQLHGRAAPQADGGSGGPAIQAEIGPIDYPDSYTSPARFIENAREAFRDPAAPSDPARLEWYCFACSFSALGRHRPPRPCVADRGPRGRHAGASAGPAARRPVHRSRTLKRGERAYVAAGDVTDAFGNVNGAPSADLKGRG